MDDDAELRLVSERRAALLGTALLLTGNRAAAEELVQRVLARTPGAGDDVLLRAVVRGATGRWARTVRTEQVVESAPFAVPTQEPGVAELLRELPPRTRAVVVLRWHAQLPDDRIAALVGCPVPAVGTEAARGLAALTPALAPDPFRRPGAEVPAPQRLTAELARLAAAPGRWRLTGPDAVADLRARRSATRRRRVLAGVAVLAVAVAVPVARRTPDAPAPPSAPPAAAATQAPSSRAVPVLTGPTRGSLAGDPAFLAALRATSWGGLEAPPPEQRTVVFAGDTPAGRVALVVGTVLEDFRGVWLTGPVGAPAGDLVPHLPRQLGEQRPLTLLVGGPGEGSLVVVAAPGDEISVSDRLMTGPRGTVGRSYTPVAAPDGVAVVPARSTSLGPAVSVQVVREGREVYRSAADWTGSAPPTALPALTPLRPSGTPDPHLVDAAVEDLALPLGVEPAALTPQVLWSTDDVAVVVAYSPGGALVVTTWAAGVGSCGTQTPPGTTDVGTLTIARACPAADGPELVVSAPPDAAFAEVLDPDGQVLRPLALTGGGVVLDPMPSRAGTVRTRDAAGTVLRETPIAPPPPEPFGGFGPGPQR